MSPEPRACPHCHEPNRPEARFCDECGAAVARAAAEMRAVRVSRAVDPEVWHSRGT